MNSSFFPPVTPRRTDTAEAGRTQSLSSPRAPRKGSRQTVPVPPLHPDRLRDPAAVLPPVADDALSLIPASPHGPASNTPMSVRALSTALGDSYALVSTTSPSHTAHQRSFTSRRSQRVTNTAHVEQAARPLLSCWPSTVGGTHSASGRSQLAADIEAHLQRHAGPSTPWEHRGDAFREALKQLAHAFPSFATAFELLNATAGEMVSEVTRLGGALSETLEQRAAEVAAEKDQFYKAALLEVLADKRKAERAARTAKAECDRLRDDRDGDLNQVKRELVEVIRTSHGDDHELSHLRQLLSSVFRANSELRDYIHTLEEELKRATSDRNEPYLPTRHLHQQVTSDYMKASEDEMLKSRLSTQRALIDSAVTSRSALRVKSSMVESENIELKEKLARLEQQLEEAERRAHEQRYVNMTLPPEVFYALQQDRIFATDPSALTIKPVQVTNEITPDMAASAMLSASSPHDDTLQATATSGSGKAASASMVLVVEDKLRPECYTPRPSIPFEIQSDLGIRLLGRTRVVVEQLCDLSLRQHRSAMDSAVTIRNLQVATAWMEPTDVEAYYRRIAEIDTADTRPFFNTVPEAEWPNTLHFLRTSITPHVINKAFTKRQIARMARELMLSYRTFSDAARNSTRQRMVAPKQPQLWERRRVHLAAPLDATATDLSKADVEVPRGYVVSEYLRHVATQASGGKVVSELEMATLAYNFWNGLVRFRFHEPTCEAVLLFLDGQLPLDAYINADAAIRDLYDRLTCMDTLHSGALPYKVIATTLLQIFQKDAGPAWRGALHSVVKTAREHRMALADKLPLGPLTATEDTDTGASDLSRFFVRHAIQKHEAFYDTFEAAVTPLARESVAMKALVVVSVGEILLAAARLDDQQQQQQQSGGIIERSESSTSAVDARLGQWSFFRMAEVLTNSLPRLNASAHLPPPKPSGDDKSKKKAKKAKAHAVTKVVALMTEANSNDQSLVEWYALGAALRNTPPEFATPASAKRQSELTSANAAASQQAYSATAGELNPTTSASPMDAASVAPSELIPTGSAPPVVLPTAL
jgi:hypothetical protein